MQVLFVNRLMRQQKKIKNIKISYKLKTVS